MADDEFVIRITDDFKEATGSKSKDEGGGLFGAGLGLGAGIAAIFEIAGLIKEVVGGVLKPIMNIIKGGLKLLMEFLRPLVEVVMFLLRPVLMLIRPLVELFKVFMAPFMDIARQFGRMAQEQMAAGNISAAMGLSIEAAQTVLGPFVVSMVGVAMELINTTVITGIAYLINLMLGAIGNALSVIPGIGDELQSAMMDAQAAVSSGSQVIIDFLNGQITNLTQNILGSMLEDAQARLDEFKEKYPSEYSNTFIETPAGALAEMAKVTGTDVASMQKSMKDGMDVMDVTVTTKFDKEKGGAVSTFKTGLDSMSDAVDGFVGKLQGAANTINSILISASSRGTRSEKTSLDLNVGPFGVSYEHETTG